MEISHLLSNFRFYVSGSLHKSCSIGQMISLQFTMLKLTVQMAPKLPSHELVSGLSLPLLKGRGFLRGFVSLGTCLPLAVLLVGIEGKPLSVPAS